MSSGAANGWLQQLAAAHASSVELLNQNAADLFARKVIASLKSLCVFLPLSVNASVSVPQLVFIQRL
jgi:hypothetical protein